MTAHRFGPPPALDRARSLLVVRFAEPHEVLSWAIVNGGRRRASAVVWREVALGELTPDIDARALLGDALGAAQLPDAVGLLTARAVDTFEEITAEDGPWAARSIATVGLGNALAAGDPPGPLRPGTINLLCQLSCALTEEALIEACALVTEARTAAVLAAGVPSLRSDRVATGTGTDCVVIAAPVQGERQPFAGKHTAIGALVGRVAHEATARGVARWVAEQRRC